MWRILNACNITTNAPNICPTPTILTAMQQPLGRDEAQWEQELEKLHGSESNYVVEEGIYTHRYSFRAPIPATFPEEL